MDGLFFFVAVTESDRQMAHHLNGTGPHGPIEAPGRLERLRNRFQRSTVTQPVSLVTPAAMGTVDEPGKTDLHPTAPAASR